MTANIEQLPSGKYRARVVVGGRRLHSPAVATAAEAEVLRDLMLNKRQEQQAVEIDAKLPEDPDTVLKRALMQQRMAERQRPAGTPTVTFEHEQLIGLVGIGDQHFGAPGTDVARAFDEAYIIAETPGLYPIVIGDVVDNFVIGKLAAVRFDYRLSVGDEWALLRKYLDILGPKLLAVVEGNHDGWTTKLTGIDYFGETVKRINENVLFDPQEARFTVRVGGWSVPVKVRHSWPGTSQWNPTHAIERAAVFDQDFQIGFGGHIHERGGLARQFAMADGDIGLAIQVGTYKRFDPHLRTMGTHPATNATAITALLDPQTRTVTGISNLELAARIVDVGL